MNNNISNLQDIFKEYLFTGANEEKLLPCIAERNNIPAQQRLDVYRNAYYIRLQEAIAHDYPTLLAVAGDQRFAELVTLYINANPSISPSLREFGKNLSLWFRSHNEFMLADVAALEWAVLDAFDARNAQPLSAETLAQVPASEWQTLQFSFHPSVSFLTVRCNARECWSAVRNEAASIPTFQADKQECLVVWRAAKGPATQSINTATYGLLSGLKRGHSFGDCCLRLAESLADESTTEEQAPEQSATALALACNAGWIVGMSNNEQNPSVVDVVPATAAPRN